MTPEELRNKLMARMDSLLARPFLLWGDDRRMVSALRGYAHDMPASELERLMTYLVSEQVQFTGEQEREQREKEIPPSKPPMT